MGLESARGPTFNIDLVLTGLEPARGPTFNIESRSNGGCETREILFFISNGKKPILFFLLFFRALFKRMARVVAHGSHSI